jgi:hypothetical protein
MMDPAARRAEIDRQLAALKAERKRLRPVSVKPGHVRSRSFKPEGEGQRKPRVTDNAHLAFIRRLPCVACGASPCDAAHVRFGDAARGKINAGMQRKPDDSWTLPLDRRRHERQHSGNERAFYEALGVDALALCEALYAVSGDLEKGRALILSKGAA